MGMPPGTPPGGGAGAPGGPQLATVLGALANKQQDPAQDFAKQNADLQGADPSMIQRQLKSIYDVLGVTFVKSYQQMPKVAGEISTTMKALGKALKAIEEASQVQEVVGKGASEGGPQPISFGPAMSGLPQGGNPAQ
jgi:hypothetical protein